MYTRLALFPGLQTYFWRLQDRTITPTEHRNFSPILRPYFHTILVFQGRKWPGILVFFWTDSMVKNRNAAQSRIFTNDKASSKKCHTGLQLNLIFINRFFAPYWHFRGVKLAGNGCFFRVDSMEKAHRQWKCRFLRPYSTVTKPRQCGLPPNSVTQIYRRASRVY